MIIISDINNNELGIKLAANLGASFMLVEKKNFSGNETLVNIADKHQIANQDVLIIYSVYKSVNDNFFEILLLADLLRYHKCKSISLFIPYFGYSRQDTYQYGSSAATLISSLLNYVGIKNIMTCDIHSVLTPHIYNIDMSEVFIPYLKKNNYLVISPDVGGKNRVSTFAKKINAPYLILNKIKNANGEYDYSNLNNEIIGENCLIVDDIIDTGNTLHQLTTKMLAMGVKSISLCITHGIFSGNALNKLSKIKFKEFYVTDTIMHQTLPSWIKIINISNYVAAVIKEKLS